jgi:tRNA(His) 5'-end guanylyltransferase
MNIGDRMKDYESRSNFMLQRKLPVIARLDGKAFHTLTRNLDRPFDENFHKCMVAATVALCGQIQGCQIGYTQSDEITLLLTDWKTYNTDAWFGYRVQKMCSVSASIASVAFAAAWRRNFGVISSPPAYFDARFWNITSDEVNNVFLWRQRDAEKNSITGLAQAYFSHKELHGMNGSDKQDMLMSLNPPVNWNDIATWKKRGSAIVKTSYEKNGAQRTRWEEDPETPIFSKDTKYVNQYLIR